MHKIMVANPKGGCGKSTLAIHLASWFAQRGAAVCLGDLDRQKSSHQWLERRPARLPKIVPWLADSDAVSMQAPPSQCKVAILDSAAGLHGKALKHWLGEVNRVVVPISPSPFDMHASERFFEELAATKALRKERVSVAVVGMRVDARTLAARELLRFLDQFELPLVTCLRDTQRYVHATAHGMSIFDYRDPASEIDRAQWRPLQEWLITSAHSLRG